MRLSTIKLSGFKSFVDPTTLHLPTNMTGVVGPNGCGKSNIIDAVRWVMGESSASRLRGDSLTDVIFAGSSARKPVSQAMVELVFDNADHAIGGEYASFAEISVKRVVGRDGTSQYYLNGSRCRRRDITDLFLGTGLGPRSYSIIEQGMISQIIEARPEDLRVYLEEAAGISRYKERRRETETRIRHTRENLDRLNDLRDEVGKQLQHLARQARQAEQYQALQAERQVRDAEWKALEHRALARRLQVQREKLAQQETRLEELVAGQREAERGIETGRVRREEAAEVLNRAQAESYEVGGTLARIEQQIQHQQELASRLQRAREQAQSQLSEIAGHIASDQARLEVLGAAIEADEPRLEALREEDAARQDALHQAEQALADWQQRWESHARAQSEAGREADIQRTRIEHLDRQAMDAERRREALVAERAGLDVDALAEALADLFEQHGERQLALDELGEALESRKAAVATLQEEQRTTQSELAAVRQQAQAARGRLSSLEALQHAALGQERGAALSWLKARGLDTARRVGEALDVDAGWEIAVEAALGQVIEGVLVDAPGALVDALGELGDANLALVSGDAGDAFQAPADSLASRVRGPSAIRGLLAPVRVAEDMPAALAMQRGLGEGESIITRNGERLGRGWVQVLREGAASQGALQREREIQELRAGIESLQAREEALDTALGGLRERLLAAEQQREEAQRTLYMAHRKVSELAGQLQGHQGRLENARGRIERIESELLQLAGVLEAAADQVREARALQEEAVVRMGELEDARQALEAERRTLAEARDQARSLASGSRDAVHSLALTLESRRAELASLSQSLQRMGGQRGQLDSRLQELREQMEEGSDPASALEEQRQVALEQRVLAEQNLVAARTALDGIDQELRRLEQVRQQRDEQAIAQREAIGQRRLDQQALVLKAEGLLEAITEAGFVPDEVAATLTDDMDAEAWGRTVAELDAKLRRLEPVNLAAIAEHAESAQRKEYLDSQHADLTGALETLEDAIRRIDRETRGRFRDTFDRVNSGVQQLYPRLFGGGHAYLELTGEDLLDTGVAIMARPPGKRVSNISLLSGGEKAMTAVALVFAIFQLNPAPFCLLDEVDAPLDEANVGRLASLVKEMSEQVQFLFVTHNKATMEVAEQLSGVTMREPGVSRLVSVDLAEAARLAGAA